MEITYRLIEKKDLEHRVKWLNNPNVNKFWGWQVRGNTMTLEKEIDHFKEVLQQTGCRAFIIEVDDKPIGIVGLSEISPIDKNAAVDIMIGEDDFRGKGFGKKAMQFIIDYGFETLKLHKLYLHVNEYNENAIALYKSLSFVIEGTLKGQVFYDNKFYDEFIMALFNKNS